ncbi:4-hydroxyphenylpyruvate dioxygenase OS=Afipia felis OX=1035 GN=NCTC12722_01540 PE=4 SV=1 [Afipia felis]
MDKSTGADRPFTVVWDHVHLRVTDPDTAAAWFEDVLCGEVLRTPGRVDVIIGGQKIFLLKAPDTDKPSPAHPHRGLDHFGVHVKDIDQVAATLKAKGVRFIAEPQTPRPGIRIAFLEGPDGVSIEILERDEKYR